MKVVPTFMSPSRVVLMRGASFTLRRGVEIEIPDALAEVLLQDGSAVPAGEAPPPLVADDHETEAED